MNVSKTLALAAAAVMAANPEARVVHVCQDKNVFLDEVKGLAEHHCRTNKLPAPVAVTREELVDLIEPKVKDKQRREEEAERARAEKAEADRVAAQEREEAERIAKEEADRAAKADLTQADPEQLEADAAKALAAINETDDDATDTQRTAPEVFLNGSANQQDLITIRKGWKLTLAQVVRHAHAMTTLSADEWNALSDAERDVYIDDAVLALKETPKA